MTLLEAMGGLVVCAAGLSRAVNDWVRSATHERTVPAYPEWLRETVTAYLEWL